MSCTVTHRFALKAEPVMYSTAHNDILVIFSAAKIIPQDIC